MKTLFARILLIIMAICVLGAIPAGADYATAAAVAPAAGEPRNPQWAVPRELEGAPNFFQVTEQIYRSAQPTIEGFKNLEKFGVKTIISLRDFHDDRNLTKGTQLRLERVAIDTWSIRDEEILAVMRLLARKENGPFLIHCQHGADRTGVICAMYRILKQDWSKERALAELQNGGYGFHAMWKNIITYIQGANIAKLQAALAAPPPAKPEAKP